MCDTGVGPELHEDLGDPNDDANARFRSADAEMSQSYLGKSPGQRVHGAPVLHARVDPSVRRGSAAAPGSGAQTSRSTACLTRTRTPACRRTPTASTITSWSARSRSTGRTSPRTAGPRRRPTHLRSRTTPRSAGLNPDLDRDLLMNPGDRLRAPHARHPCRVPDQHHRPDHRPARLDDGQHGQRLRAGPVPAEREDLPRARRTRSTRCTHSARPRGNTWARAHLQRRRSPTRSATSSTATPSTRPRARAPAPPAATRPSTPTISSASTAANYSVQIPIKGCFLDDGDFDGPSYKLDWPGAFANPVADRKVHPTPMRVHRATSSGRAAGEDRVRDGHGPHRAR